MASWKLVKLHSMLNLLLKQIKLLSMVISSILVIKQVLHLFKQTYCMGDSPRTLISCPSKTKTVNKSLTEAKNGSHPKTQPLLHQVFEGSLSPDSTHPSLVWFYYCESCLWMWQNGLLFTEHWLTPRSARGRHSTFGKGPDSKYISAFWAIWYYNYLLLPL